ncbi:caspase family protein [Streptomyces goshikiensis]|uniref:caspase family protein n=1 Tax=Streptomyces goshikiensis TaxID=1942 RepID=UPI00378CC150
MKVEDPVDAYAAGLRQLRHDVGQPSFRELESQAKKLKLHLPRTTASDAVRGRRLPPLKVVAAFVHACGRYAEEAGLPVPARGKEWFYWQEAHNSASSAIRETERHGKAGQSADGPVPIPTGHRLPLVPTTSRASNPASFWMPGRHRCSYLLVGNSEVEGLPPLMGVPRDCKRMSEALQVAAPWMSVTTMINPTSQEAHEAVRGTLTAQAELVVLHFVGHGALNESARLSLLLRDSREDNLLQTSLNLEGLLPQASQWLRDCAVVLVVDTVYAGAVIPDKATNLGDWAVLAAAGATEAAFSWPSPDEGSFTGVLTQLLLNGIASCRYPVMTLTDLAREAGEIIRERVPQTVTWATSGRVDSLAIAYNRA